MVMNTTRNGIICCTELGLTEAFYILYIEIGIKIKFVTLTNDIPNLLSEGTPNEQDSKFHIRKKEKKNLVMSPRQTDTDGPSVAM
jgi:hypothetical protein